MIAYLQADRDNLSPYMYSKNIP